MRKRTAGGKWGWEKGKGNGKGWGKEEKRITI